MFVNGANIGSFGHEKNYTGYLSPYFVFKEGSFTKHYYIGAQRIVSKIGNGRFDNNSGLNGNGITAGGINFAKQQSWYDKKVEEYIASLGIPPGPPDKKGIYGSPEYTGQPYPDFGSPLNESNEPPLGWPKVPVFNQPGDVPVPPIKWGDPVTNDNVEAGWGYEGTGVIEETDLYFYHPDHLGSTSYVTTRLGKVSQHVEYIPFFGGGLEEKNDKWNTPYKFNSKELDDETNLMYYGARYYDSKVSVWLSVDPLAGYNPIFETEHYIDGKHNDGVFNDRNLNPYIYCYQSPVVLVDPNGKQTAPKTMFGANGLMHQTYNYYKVPNIKPVAKVEVKGSVGVQLGIKGSIGVLKGKVEAGVNTVQVGSVSAGTKGFEVTKWDGRMHNFIGGEINTPINIPKTKENLAIGGKLDYNYLYNTNIGDGISGVDGTEVLDWEIYAVIKKYSPVAKPVPGKIEANPKIKTKVDSEFYGLDIGAGVKAVLGVDVNFKIGVDLTGRIY
ncbi:MAG: RHS repeat-associated core domain-containing protein [Flavobacteriaceae bacterium]|jgi:RHS repeat-associated protein|nr:RHS repeat-associated core domain-containing protein [Flavobacteriaceae bacterium]